jgi:hypothetical protein
MVNTAEAEPTTPEDQHVQQCSGGQDHEFLITEVRYMIQDSKWSNYDRLWILGPYEQGVLAQILILNVTGL